MSNPVATLPPALDQLVQRLHHAADPKRKYEYLLWLTKRLPAFPEPEKVIENKVPGCISQVYVTAKSEDGKVFFQGDSDSQLTKGLVALLIEGLNGLTPQQILQLTSDFIEATGLNISLTPSRANGFYNIFRSMQQKAVALDVEHEE